jgi:hypothetical protein
MTYQIFVDYIACFKIYIYPEAITRAMCVINFNRKIQKELKK